MTETHLRRAKLKELLPLRALVLRPGKSPENCEFPGDRDATTRHYIASIGDRIAGIASLYERASPHPEHRHEKLSFQLRSMAIRPQLQRQHIGSKLLQFVLSDPFAEDPRLIWCNARVRAVPFYARAGFRTCGEAFMVPEIGMHQYMFLHCTM